MYERRVTWTTVQVHSPDGVQRSFTVVCRYDTEVELEYARNGGILHYMVRKLCQNN
jgi:aconitate hydratase